MSTNKYVTQLLYGIVITALFVSCSAERKNILSKTFHNTTARYNAYFYSKERIKEIEATIEESRDNDYNRVLKIYPEVDSTLAKSYEEPIDDAIKKASLAIQRHKNSKWVDDSYILIGLARLYSLDFVNAIETFKYVNTHSEDDAARHEALIDLYRTFTDYKEYNNAIAVSDYLKKEKLNKDNSKDLFMTKAHFHQQSEDLDNMVKNLILAAPLLKRKEGKGRIYFIIGQIYQELGFDAEAFNYYKKCISSNPPYELDFYARLNMAQVTELNRTGDVRTAQKRFKKLLRDKKNKEYKDKIYFEMGKFEQRQNNMTKAIDHYKSSVASSINNNRQKGQSYLHLGIVYFDSLKSYELAQNYYDSAVTALPKDFENYDKIKARQEILDDFVKQIKTIQLEDSLLALAALDSVALKTQLEEFIALEEKRKKEEEEAKLKKQRRSSSTVFNSLQDATGISGANWYFGNPSAVAQGQSEFIRVWGDRVLEDNWRRTNKASTSEQLPDERTADTPVDGPVGAEPGGGDQPDGADQATARIDQLYATIPFSEEQKEASLEKIKDALYNLGTIYNLNLEEKKNASDTFVKLLDRFPGNEYEAEVLYQLYLINKSLEDPSHLTYKDRLLSEYGNTTYAKLVGNPNYAEESTASNEQLKKIYKKAYEEYLAKDYNQARNTLQEGFTEHPETVFTANLKLLSILIKGKTEDINVYQYDLDQFIKTNPDSDITPYAQELLTASRTFLEKQRKLLGTKYVKYFKQEHYFVLVFDSKDNLTDKIYPEVDKFTLTEFQSANKLNASNLILNDNQVMIMVSGLTDKSEAQRYFRKFRSNDPIGEKKLNAKFHKFIITKDNFNIFYQSKDISSYIEFFRRNYGL